MQKHTQANVSACDLASEAPVSDKLGLIKPLVRQESIGAPRATNSWMYAGRRELTVAENAGGPHETSREFRGSSARQTA